MIETFRFDNINGSSLVLNDLVCPIGTFSTEVDARFTERQRSQQHGIYLTDTYWGKRLFHVSGDILAADSASYIAKRLSFMEALLPRPQLGLKIAGTLNMTFTGMSEGLTADCTVDGYPELPLDGANGPARSSYLINFKAFDPRCYGFWQQASIYGTVDNIGGRTYDKTYNKSYSTSGGPNSLVIPNVGNVESYPILEIHGPTTSPSVWLVRGDGVVLKFTLQGLVIAAGDYVTVDMQKRTVSNSSGLNVYQYAVGSDWWAIEPSPYVNTVYYVPTVLDPTSYVIVKWRNAYMI